MTSNIFILAIAELAVTDHIALHEFPAWCLLLISLII
jgi:hypothetical protein